MSRERPPRWWPLASRPDVDVRESPDSLRSRGLFLAPILMAAALRLPDLASRPMHSDEAVHAEKFGALLEGRGYAYDPAEHHGPTLYYLALVPAWLRGESRYVDIDEVTLRSVPAVLGVALVAAHLGARGVLGPIGALVAAILAAISPAMVFYSRYFIHETPLVFFSFGLLLAVSRYVRAPGAAPALLAGTSAGLMVATKETASIALGCVLLALAATHLAGRAHAGSPPSTRRVERGQHVLLALLAAVAVSAALFSSFLTHPQGIVDAVRAYGFYLDRAGAASGHTRPWSDYLRLLIFPSNTRPFWTEGLIVFLAVVGGAAAWVRKGVPAADSRALRFLGVYTLLMLVVYSAIPYKTPWCVLGFLHGLILLAGAGAVFLVRSVTGAAGRALAASVLVAAAVHLGWQAFRGSFRLASDPRNPYVYAHTGTDVFEIVARLKDLARAHPDGSSMHVQVVSSQNLWPLPFYLRGMPRVGWWTSAPDSAPNAPVILLTPDMEPAVVRRLYDVPPPGERELYVSIFERPVELRPQVEVRGYATSRLWEDYRRLQAQPGPPGRE
jgi:uncharacterized protein (TIGR03663 family)